MARKIGIWIFGILAGAIIGALLGSYLDPYGDGGFFGMVAGIFTFCCLRLWLGDSRPTAE